jgi:alpha-amylase/alpha-mannosidase (GH57 family)
MDKFICIHGHFYQPPRENPWLESIERQDSAFPYHDWNERVTAECYAPNARSRILDESGSIVRIVNNYARISFNFGPTLLSWLAARTPAVYEAILQADRDSRERYSGHGSALAQGYNHAILPLANARDQHTQVRWGIRDFEHRFGRTPEGFWLPETAVDLATLRVLARHGIRFTILAQSQAHRVRALHGRHWKDISGGRIDPSRPYLVQLGPHESIAVFFYDAAISRAVAFERLLDRGEAFARRLESAFSAERSWAQLVNIATDGESYGHHHPQGDMGLAYALHLIESEGIARLTNYGEFLERFPPTHEVQIFENSSWSCVHGVERWRANCGCNSGRREAGHQLWRAPLREALDWLRDQIVDAFEWLGARLFKDPWAARDAYIEVILERSPERVRDFLAAQGRHELTRDETVAALKLMELQRHALLMYTSCGWFFDDISGLETVQVLAYAGRVIQLAEDLLGLSLTAGFLHRLEAAKSNLPEFGDGRRIYERFVTPARTDLLKVGAHYAVTSLFNGKETLRSIYCYEAVRKDYRIFTQGRVRLALGRAVIRSKVTWEAADVSYGVLHMGDHNVTGGVRPYPGEEAYGRIVGEVTEVFERGEFPELIRTVDRHFESGALTLKLLFREERDEILRTILDATMVEAEGLYRRFYRDHAPLLRFITGMGHTVPGPIKTAAEIVLNIDLRRAFEDPDGLDSHWVQSLLDESVRAGIRLDVTELEFALRRTLQRLSDAFHRQPDRLALLRRLEAAVQLTTKTPFVTNLRSLQDQFFEVLQTTYPRMAARAAEGDATAYQWLAHFRALGELLRVATPPVPSLERVL